MNTIKKEDVNIRRMSRTDSDAIIALDPGAPLDFSFIAGVGGKVAGFVTARLRA